MKFREVFRFEFAYQVRRPWPWAFFAVLLVLCFLMTRELQAVTPDSLRYLLHDLFEVNTFWSLAAERVSVEQTSPGTWQVTLKVNARKVVVDSAGVETELPMDEWVPIGVFARGKQHDELSDPLYLQMHRIRSGEQVIAVTVTREPTLAGIDPFHVLDWEEREDDDNVDGVTIQKPAPPPR